MLPEEADSTLFASGSNDGCVFSILLLLLHLTDYCYLGSTIRLWDWRTGTALSILGQQGSFVYSLAPIPSRAGGGLASSGEDGIIKIWNEEGREEQQVLVPALSGASPSRPPPSLALAESTGDSLDARDTT